MNPRLMRPPTDSTEAPRYSDDHELRLDVEYRGCSVRTIPEVGSRKNPEVDSRLIPEEESRILVSYTTVVLRLSLVTDSLKFSRPQSPG
jgi:hypothetical protein